MAGTERRDTIVGTAARLFYDYGYPNVGMRMIADRVGIRTASLYHHFPSKEEILYEIAVHETRGFIDTQAPILDSPLDPAERLRDLFINHIVRSWHLRVQLVVTEREERELTDEHRAMIVDHKQEYRQLIQNYLKSLSARRLRAPQMRLLIVSTLSMINSVNVWFDPAGSLTIDEVADQVGTLAANVMLRALGLPEVTESPAVAGPGREKRKPAARRRKRA